MNIEHHHARLADVSLHYVTAGAGDPVLLVHGWPSTWYEWRHVMRLLAPHHRVIVPDLRGLGDSTRPLDGYDKKTVAGDLWHLLSGVLGLTRWHLVGHDWGGPVAFAWRRARRRDPDADDRRRDLARHRARHLARRQALAPRLPHDDRPAGGAGAGRERALPHLVLPVVLVAARCLRACRHRRIPAHVPQPGALRAGFAYYRNIPRDSADNRSLAESGFRLAMPVLAVGGGRAEARAAAASPKSR
jgi:pimeloyl-ACP methyl ester carboxylesterase